MVYNYYCIIQRVISFTYTVHFKEEEILRKETSKRLSAGLLASAIILNTVLSISADDGSNYHSAGESGVQGSFTSAPDISFDTIGSSGVDLKDGVFVNWIERIDVPDYAVRMYNTISDASFWTNPDNFAENGANIVEADYGNGASDKFNGLMALESESREYDYTEEEKAQIRSDCRAAFDAFDRDNPDIFWLTGETNFKSLVTFETVDDVTTYTLKTYLVLKDYVDNWDMRREEYQDTAVLEREIGNMGDAVDQILAGASGTDYEKVKYFNNYLTENNEYNTSASGSSVPKGADEALSAICGGTGDEGPVCEGYSRAFKVLCDEAGISCVLTDGEVSGSAHMWNCVKIDNSWYAVDVTLNDTTAADSEDYLLVGADTVVGAEAFGTSHPVSNTVSLNGTSFINAPAISSEAYVPSEAEKEYEAIIDDEKYETLEEAAAAASAGEIIKLLENITRDSNITVSTEAEIDLNGKSISMDGYTITFEKSVKLTDSEDTGSVTGNIILTDGGDVSDITLGDVYVSDGSFTMKNSTIGVLSVVGGTAAVSDSDMSGVSSSTDIRSLLAEGQMYYVDGSVITADKLSNTSLSGNVTVAAGKATGVITNKDYETRYIYNGSAITAPAKENFIFYGAEPIFGWNTKDGDIPVEPGTYTLTVNSGATSQVSESEAEITVVVEQYTGSAKATLEGTKGNNGWIVSKAQLVAPAGYQISTESNSSFADSISYNSYTNETVTYYLCETSTGYILPAQTIDVKVDFNPPVLSGDITITDLTASEIDMTVSASDESLDDGLTMTYVGKLGGSTTSTSGRYSADFTFTNLEPVTKYTIMITVTDKAGNTAEGTAEIQTKTGTPNNISAPTLSGVFGTAVKDMEISGGSVKYGTAVVEGTWAVTDDNSSDIPEVGTENSYKLTFTPSSSVYESVSQSVVPVVSPRSLEGAVISGVGAEYSYTGDIIKPDPGNITVTLNGELLSPDTDYVVEYGKNNINCGDDVGTVTVNGKGNYTGSASVTFDILKIDTSISLASDDIVKNFGEKSFVLDIITNNSETPFNIKVTNTDVVEVTEKGVVTIKGAGVTMVTVSQDETKNYNANTSGVSAFITILPAKAIEVTPVTIQFVHTIKNKAEIDISEIMLEAYDGKCGMLDTFSAYENSALISDVTITDEGILTFDVAAGDVGDKGTVVTTIRSQNYEETTIKVIAELTDKIPTKVKGKVTAANNLVYGQPLSDITFKDAVFVTDEGVTVNGTITWETPDAVPAVSEKVANWVFTPENEDIYVGCTGTAAISVKKAVPTVTTPVVDTMVYDADRKLSDVAINGEDGKATVNGTQTAVPGTWSWSKPTTVPNCKTPEYAAVFKPDDSANYESVDVKVIISVTKAQAEIIKMPVASAITYGQKVSDSTLKNGSANTSGKFAWADGSAVHNAGTYEEEFVFTPSDTVNYTGTTGMVSVTVNKAKTAPDMPSSKISASYDIETVGGVELPEYWSWDSADSQKGLKVGSGVTATAVYNGFDKGNYEHESIVVTITRSKCSHKNTKTINEKKATCTEKGYSGDTYCSDCDTITVSGKDVAVTDHSGGKATCTSLAVCGSCKKTYGEYDKERHSGTKVIRNAIAPTATAAGYSGDVCCSDCGVIIEKGKIIPASGSNGTTAASTTSPVWNDITTTTTKATTTKATTTTTKATTTTKKTTTTTAPEEDDDDSKYDEDAPYIYDDDEKYGWNDIIKEINKAKSGSKVEVDMNYTTELPSKALSALKGKNVDLVLHMDGDFSWVINGLNIESAKSINMEVVEDSENISVEIIDQVTGDAYSTTLTLTHNGEFGFTAVLRYYAGDTDYYANLYYYNPTKKVATFVTSDKIDDEGYAELTFDHASEYIIVIDEKDHSNRAGIEYDGAEDDDDDDYEGSEDVTIDDDLYDNGDDYYTGGDKNPSTGLGFGHVLVGILGVSAFAVRPKNEKRKRKTL